MANIDHAHGFAWCKCPHGGDQTPRIEHFTAGLAEDTVTLYRGQFVKLDGTEGTLIPIDGTFANDDLAAGTCVGVCQEYVDLAAGVLQYNVPVILAANAAFIIQADDDFVCADQAAFDVILAQANEYAITSHAGGDSLGNSTSELDGNGAAAPNYLKIVGYDRRPDNTFGAHMDLIIRFHEDLFAAGPEFIKSEA